jgi:hypothetical protein
MLRLTCFSSAFAKRRYPLSYNGKRSERDSNPRYRLTRYTAFPESIRSLTGPVWDRLLNTNGRVRPTATDWIRPPVGIGVGIEGLAITRALEA